MSYLGSNALQSSASFYSSTSTTSNGSAKSAKSNSSSSNNVRQIAQDLMQLKSSLAAKTPSARSSISYVSNTNSNNNCKSCIEVKPYNEQFLSQVEQAILKSCNPIQINETEEINVNGECGLWANKSEACNWRGPIPITEYHVNEDSNPEIITKKVQQKIEYIQELAVRYLRPPTPPAPGEIIIKQEKNIITPPAPPLIIRQQPPRPETPEPLVIREAPPKAPAQIPQKLITISGKRIPPAPRKVVIERLAPIPSKPQAVLVERWLPYAEVKRRVIFNKPAECDPVVVKPRNVIVQWEAPDVEIKQQVKYLGTIRANPCEYVQRYGSGLYKPCDLPRIASDIPTQDGLVLAADYKHKKMHDLVGDIHALRLIDLDREGLGDYKEYLQRCGSSAGSISVSAYASNHSFLTNCNNNCNDSFSASQSTSNYRRCSTGGFSTLSHHSSSPSQSRASSPLNGAIEEIFRSLDTDNDNSISVEEAGRVLLRLNSKLGRKYGEDDVNSFFAALDANNNGVLDFDEFKKAFLNACA